MGRPRCAGLLDRDGDGRAVRALADHTPTLRPIKLLAGELPQTRLLAPYDPVVSRSPCDDGMGQLAGDTSD
ncbi:hypothetical protein Msi02_06100 [Microbispora siamensis]|uniref:Uncharacterized protein n=1 Tax=Microbispora siamensis TaxID=564413 RepID=A0ABQ4GEE6_9ACTN|nr:hypothetical protein Msi02_06100 [Microbispora siamensis]